MGYERKSKEKVDSKTVGLESLLNDRAGDCREKRLGEKTRSSILDMVSLRSSLAIQMEVFSRQFDIQDRGLG